MTETDVLRSMYAALNRNDIAAAVSAFDPEIEWIDPVEDPATGTYRGLAVVKAHFSKSRDTWAEGSCEPERFVLTADKVVALVHVHVRLRGSTQWLDAQLADVYTFRDGKVIQARCFIDPQKGLAWADVNSMEAT